MLVSLHNPTTLCIQFRYSAGLIEKIKTLPGRRYNAVQKYWTAPNSEYVINKLEGWGFSFDEFFITYNKRKKNKLERGFKIANQNVLRDYQIEGVNFFAEHKGNILMADEQGLGKSIQTISYIHSADKIPALIICPSSVKLNWRKEIIKWTEDENVFVAYGKTPDFSGMYSARWTIINYDILTHWVKAIAKVPFKMMVLDESQSIKNEKSQRCNAVMKIAKLIGSRAALSGTPIMNRPIELFTTFKYIDPYLFPSKFKFGKQFCNLKNTGFGWDYSGSSNTEELNRILSENFMIRRLKKDVLKELPDKQKVVIPLEMSDASKKKYKKSVIEFRELLKNLPKKQKAARALLELNKMRQITIEGKMDLVLNWIDEFLSSGKKLVVFAWHQSSIDAIYEKFKDIAVKLDGSCNDKERQRAVDYFQNVDSVKLFVGNIKAAGVGITLTAASDTATVELSWSPSDLEQADDRVHRIGQQNQVVNYYLLAENTIDTEMMHIIDKKKMVIDSVMNGKETEELSLLSELIHIYE